MGSSTLALSADEFEALLATGSGVRLVAGRPLAQWLPPPVAAHYCAFLHNVPVSQNVDLVRESASHGVPDDVRARVWALLLGVRHPDPAAEPAAARAREEHYRSLNRETCEHQRVRGARRGVG